MIKKIFQLLLVLFIFFTISCKKKNDANQKNTEKKCDIQELTWKVNGREINAKSVELPLLVKNDDFFGEPAHKLLDINGNENDSIQLLLQIIHYDNGIEGDSIPPGKYFNRPEDNYCTPGSTEYCTEFNATYQKIEGFTYSSFDELGGYIEITETSAKDKLVSGNFSFRAVNIGIGTGDTIQVEGAFVDLCYTVF